MESISLGYNKTYSWDSYGSSVNLQNTNITTPTASDGWKVLAFISPTTSKVWSDLVGFTATGDSDYSCTIVNSTLYLLSPSVITGRAMMYDLDWGNGGVGDNTWSLATLCKVSTWATGTSSGAGSGANGFRIAYQDGTRIHDHYLRSDGTNIDIYSDSNGSGNFVKKDTTQSVDNTRWHIWRIYNNNGANATVHTWDGVEIATGVNNFSSIANPGQIGITVSRFSTDARTAGYHAFTYYFNSITSWTTTDGTWTSTYDNSIFDAGPNNVWQSADWTVDVSNSTTCSIQVRTADTAAQLTSATYFTPTSGVNWTTCSSFKRFIQVMVTFSDASSGLYTPILKDLTLNYGASIPSLKGINSWKGIDLVSL